MELKEYLLNLSERFDIAAANSDLAIFTDEEALQWAAELREFVERMDDDEKENDTA